MAKPASKSAAKAPARTVAAQRRADAAALTPEPAVMAAGASLENKVEGKGSPPAEPPTEADAPEAAAEARARESGAEPTADGRVVEADAAAQSDDEGSRDDSGRFTGKPASMEEKVDALIEMAQRNGWSIPKVLRRPKDD